MAPTAPPIRAPLPPVLPELLDELPEEDEAEEELLELEEEEALEEEAELLLEAVLLPVLEPLVEPEEVARPVLPLEPEALLERLPELPLLPELLPELLPRLPELLPLAEAAEELPVLEAAAHELEAGFVSSHLPAEEFRESCFFIAQISQVRIRFDCRHHRCNHRVCCMEGSRKNCRD